MRQPGDLSVVALCALMPVVTMTTYKGGSLTFYLLIAVCLALMVTRRTTGGIVAAPDGDISAGVVVSGGAFAPGLAYRPVFYAWIVPFLAVAVSMVGYGKWAGTNAEAALRFSLGLPILTLALLRIDSRVLRQSIWGVYAAAWAATAYVAQLALYDYPRIHRADTQIYNAVGYGNLMLLLGVLTCFSLSWRLTPWRWAETVFKIATAVATFGGFILTQTRSGWVAVPVFVLLGVLVLNAFRRPVRGVALFLAAIAVLTAIGASSPALRDRVEQGYQQAVACTGENSIQDTSICIRFQLWRAAWTMFKEHPIVGVGGKNRYQEIMQEDYVRKGIVSQYVADNWGESHNDMMMALANFGVLGGLGLMALYFAPLWVLLRRLHSRYPIEIRSAAAMGVCVCLGFAIFGLTEMMFRGMRTVGFYTLLVALFMVLSDPGREQR